MSKWFGIGLLGLFLLFPQIAAQGISDGLEQGFLVLMPAIFPYMVVSQVFLKTGGAGLLCRLLPREHKLRRVFPILIPSLFCGYPTGARLASQAYNNHEISKNELYGMYGFGNIPGFGFTVSYVGGMLYQNLWLGLQIYLSFLCASVFLWCLFGLWKREIPITVQEQEEKVLPFSSALVEAVTESSLSMVSLLCFVCFFSSLICFLKSLKLSAPFCAALCAGLEITAGLPLVCQYYPLSFLIFFAGFSGLCVMLQSLFFDKANAVNLLWLLILRSIYGIVSVGFFWGIRALI